MIQIRRNVFETNSSSCHSLCIVKDDSEIKIPNYLTIRYDDYGWSSFCLDTVDEKVSYLATAMMDMEMLAEFDDFVEVLKGFGIKVHVKEYDYSGVDHCGELIDFIHDVLADHEKLKRFLFDDRSCVYTGNDNGCEEEDNCFIAFHEIDWIEDENGKWIENGIKPNPRQDTEHFEYYFKGN